ncbi:MAG: HDOD domain-containing protein [Desulfobacterales bacterium]|nr:HDOD domain-containing protein [Desulfobacterales bacterium]
MKSLLEIIDERLADDATLLPVFDRTAIQVQREIAKADPDVGTIERLIVSDQSLTSQVLRTANSAFYKGLSKVATIRSAIVRLGTEEIAKIVLLVTQRRQFQTRDPKFRQKMLDLWKHSVGCGIGAQWLAKECGFRSMVYHAFTAGLLHDVGKLLLMSVLSAIDRSPEIDMSYSDELTREILEGFHARYGHDLLKNWNLPEIYCRAARDHHIDDFDKNDTLLLLIRVANQACHKLGIGCDPDPDLAVSALPEASLLGVSEIILARLEIQLEDALILA